jgi:hypothetical protein
LILSGLKQGGFVESRRGAEGGYRLARPADQITVGRVLKYVEQSKRPGVGRRLYGSVEAGGQRSGRLSIPLRWAGPALKEAQTRFVPTGDLMIFSDNPSASDARRWSS